MNVEFIKFHLSRSRKIHYTTVATTNSAEGKSFHQNSTEQHLAAIRFSSMYTSLYCLQILRKLCPTYSKLFTIAYNISYCIHTAIVDIGSASFKYDMRRLTEILAFPKAWYRRSIVRRLFLGDLSTASMFGDDSASTQGTHSGTSSPLHQHPPRSYVNQCKTLHYLY